MIGPVSERSKKLEVDCQNFNADVQFSRTATTFSGAMVPRKPEDESSSDSRDDESASASSASESLNGAHDHPDELEQEYHTEESDKEDVDEDESDTELELAQNATPLLPEELLKPLPSPAYSLQHPINIPWEQMTRQQRVSQRNRSRKAKKRVWEALRRDSQGTGVVEAGRAAQYKRGLLLQREKVSSGRVAKKRRPAAEASGRQQLLEQRKRAAEQSKSQLLPLSKKGRKRRSRRAQPG